MIGSLVRLACVAVLALAPAACAFHVSPADGLRFEPPAGWNASPGILGVMQFWRAPADDREVLILFKSPREVKSSDIFSSENLRDSLRDVKIVRRQSILICGAQPATYARGVGSSSRGGRTSVDLLITDSGGTTYLALYTRPVAVQANPMALAALREVCPKS